MKKGNKLKYTLGFILGTNLVSVNAQELAGATQNVNFFNNPVNTSDNINPMSEEEMKKELLDLMENNPFMEDTKVVMSLSMAAAISENEFINSAKYDLPIAPKNNTGKYYLDLDSPYKAVTLPTEIGEFSVNLEAMRLRQMAAEKQLEIDLKASDARGEQPRIMQQSASHPVNHVYLVAVSSENFDDPATSGVEMDVLGSSFNHGGSWVGAVSQEIGNSSSFGMNICGISASTHSFGVVYYANGNEAGMWRAMYSNGCQSGWIQSWAAGTWGTYFSSSVHFN